MPTHRPSALTLRRVLTGPALALGLSLALGLLPLRLREGCATVLERSVFLPFRLAVGWGPRSLLAEQRSARIAREATEKLQSRIEDDEIRAENVRLRDLLGFRRRADFSLFGATVVGRTQTRFGDLLLVDLSDPLAVTSGMPVVCSDGLVGRVSRSRGNSARVECLTHQNVAVSVRNSRSREGGIVKWSPQTGGLVIEGVPSQADWQVGDRLTTSGLGTAFPRGLLVGWIVGQKKEGGGLLKTLLVRPAVRSGRVDEVFLLESGPGGAPDASGLDLSALFPNDPYGRARFPLNAPVGPDPGPVPVP